jgi:hypothetical protein
LFAFKRWRTLGELGGVLGDEVQVLFEAADVSVVELFETRRAAALFPNCYVITSPPHSPSAQAQRLLS